MLTLAYFSYVALTHTHTMNTHFVWGPTEARLPGGRAPGPKNNPWDVGVEEYVIPVRATVPV